MSGDHEQLVDDFGAAIAALVPGGRYGISLGGSRAKQRADSSSDFDFRLYADDLPDRAKAPARWGRFDDAVARWEARGTRIDGLWIRGIAAIDAALDRWLTGDVAPEPLVWTVWGYHLPTDIFSQTIIADPDGVLAHWRQRLSTYPDALRSAVLAKHLDYIRYWRDDYHWESKVRREDRVFLAGLAARLVHSLYQLVFALNGVYFPGDGWNERIGGSLPIAPRAFARRANAALYPLNGDLAAQRVDLIGLIDETVALAGQSSSR